jgi:hypothetical protein
VAGQVRGKRTARALEATDHEIRHVGPQLQLADGRRWPPSISTKSSANRLAVR